jgi:prephenate dehydrogenase
LDQIRETMAIIAQDLKEGAVVMDTGPVKEVVSAWAGELLPEGRFYVGLTPVINPAYLHGADTGLQAAHADLFKKGLIAIVAPPRAPSEAIKLAADLARLLGADPLFFDPVELDSMMGATHILPQLMAAALVNTTVDQPGWREARKIAGRAYAEVTGPIVQFSEPSALVSAAVMNRENIVRVMDSLIAGLETLRNDISQTDSAALQSRLERAQRGRERWWHERTDANWIAEEVSGTTGADAAKGGELLRRLMGLGTWPKPKKKE